MTNYFNKRGITTLVGRLYNGLRRMEFLRQALKVAWHIIGIPISYWVSYLLRFDGTVPPDFQYNFIHTLPILMAICLLSFLAFRLFSDTWSYFSVDDLVRMTASVALGVGIFGAFMFSRHVGGLVAPRSIIVLEFIFLNLWLGAGRLVARYLRRYAGLNPGLNDSTGERLLLVGTLEEADRLIRESHRSGLGRMVGVVGADISSQNIVLHGLRIPHRQLDEIEDILRRVNPDTILIMPPYNRPRDINKIMAQISATGHKCAFRTIPSLCDLATGQLTASSIRNVDIQDLLERGQVEFDRTEVRRFLKGKCVLVTGAGGSIGSEIVRQVCNYEPETIVLFEQSEYGLYSMELEMYRTYPNLNVIPVAGDVRSRDSVRYAFEQAKVDVVYHAAAYKHVPLMEQNVSACFHNNVVGTACVAEESVRAGVERFVMISSDKAVRPTSVMGATKRLAERVLNEMDAGETTFVSVRFGNVLGSSGSVVPLFKDQIRAGGPVTVTSEDIRRFFMTIPEAVDLVLQAGTVGRHREIMVLEMGEEIKIIDMARRLIELSGLIPDKDIKIKITGMRPGEKEYEEVMTEDENVLKTAFDKIWVIKKNRQDTDLPSLDLKEIVQLISKNDSDKLRKLAAYYVPENCFKCEEEE